MSLLEKLTSGFTGKQQKKQETDLTQVKEQLKKLVYDDELVDEFAPIFAKLSTQEGFDKVVELLETKESQLEQFASGDLFNSKLSDDEQDLEQEDNEVNNSGEESLTAEQILKQKYSK